MNGSSQTQFTSPRRCKAYYQIPPVGFEFTHGLPQFLLVFGEVTPVYNALRIRRVKLHVLYHWGAGERNDVHLAGGEQYRKATYHQVHTMVLHELK